MNIIVAVSSNWGIGYKNDLLFRISPDLKRFKKLTMGKTIIMGRNTFKSLPNQQPLPGRRNIVMSRDPRLEIPGAYVANSKEQVMEMVNCSELFASQKAASRPRLSSRFIDEVFIIGGEQIYELFLDDCTRVYLTKVRAAPPADAFFPNLDEKPEWHLAHKSELHYADGYEFMYYELVKEKKGEQ